MTTLLAPPFVVPPFYPTDEESVRLRAVTYSRSSSAKQKSIDDQTSDNEVACATNRFTIVDQLTDKVSASRYGTKKRDAWAVLLAMLPNIDVVVLWEPSRGDRSLSSWAAFLDACRVHGVKIHATSHFRTYDPRNSRDMRSLSEDGVDAQYESDKLSERVLRGTRKAAGAGVPAGRTVYGLRRRYTDGSEGKPRYIDSVPNAETAPVVVDIFKAIAAGTPLYQVRAKLNADGIPTPAGGTDWSPTTIRQIATNRTYAPHPDNPERGCLHGTNGLNVGTWPPLITADVWDTVQSILGMTSEKARKNRKASAPGAVKYLLSGSARLLTARCGFYMAGYADSALRPGYYSCAADGCVNVPMAEADRFVLDTLTERLSRPDARAVSASSDAAATAAAAELKRLRAELDDAYESAGEEGGLTARGLAIIEGKLLPRIQAAEKRSLPAGTSAAMLALLDAARFGAERVHRAWEALALPARREVVASVFELLAVGPATVRAHRWLSPEERFELVAGRITVRIREAEAA